MIKKWKCFEDSVFSYPDTKNVRPASLNVIRIEKDDNGSAVVNKNICLRDTLIKLIKKIKISVKGSDM